MLKTSNDQRKLLPNFDQLFATTAQAPGGVARLRELILTLAVQGKLVTQDANDEPASELLKKISAEKERLIAEGKIKKDKPLGAITEDEKPFELPVGWEWVRISLLAHFENGDRGSNYPSRENFVENGIAFINAGHLVNEKVDYSEMNYITSHNFELLRSGKVKKNDILYCLRGSLGKFAQVDNDISGAIASSLVIVRLFNSFMSSYTKWYLKSPLAYSLIKRFDNGTAQPNLGAGDLAKFIFPLPPLAEQSRIVARVEELMRLCDALEEKGRLEHAQHQQLLQAMLDSLTQTQSAQELARHWQRLAQHFDLLIDRPEAVDALEQTILQLAVRGLLVEQDASDEPASELLRKIRAEKDRLIAEGKIKKDKPLPVIGDEEKPFDLPAGWEWARVGSLGVTQTGGTPSSGKAENFDGKFPFIGPGQITLKGEVLPAEKFISKIGCLESAQAEPNDILMVCIGGSIGKCAAAPFATAFNQQINSIRPIYSLSEFVLFAMRSPEFFSSVIGAATGSATPIISRGKWDLLLFPLPPLAEQSRIVARVTELRALCQQLRDKLTQASHTQTQLAQAWVEQATA